MKTNRLLALVLALVMLVSIPVLSNAADDDPGAPVLAAASTTQKVTQATTKKATTQKATTVKSADTDVTTASGPSFAEQLAKKIAEAKAAKTTKADTEKAEESTKASKSTTKKSGKEATTVADVQTSDLVTKAKSSGKLFGNVGTLYICISDANPEMPHVWLYFINTSGEAQQFGAYTVPAGQVVSVGAFHDRGNGNGIYYNLERYWVKPATYNRTVSMSTKVNATELKLVNLEMKFLDNWTYVFNCDWFATCIWNTCSPIKLIHLGYPQITRVQMKLWGAQGLPITISKVGNVGNVYKQTKDYGLTPVVKSVTYTNYGV